MPNVQKTDIKDLTHDQLIQWLAVRNIKSYRAGQILRWIYHHKADSFEVMTNLGKELRGRLARHFTAGRLEIVETRTSEDGSRKFLFRLGDGALIESVLIPERDHYTLCVSSQVGCAQGCRFCMTGRSGFQRDLTVAEILGQVRDIRDGLDGSTRLTNIVFMGMGEPLANYKNVIQALGVLTDAHAGMGFANRRVTVSTVGLTPGIRALGEDAGVNLAVSLNAVDNETRSRLMPLNRRHPIEELLEACRTYPLRPQRLITFEYILMAGVNDRDADAHKLAALLRPVKAKINLIPFNSHPGSKFERPAEEIILRFREILHNHRYTTVIRRSKGLDISAACGQLRAERMGKGPGTTG
ncbi:MAG: 23S rRNA (adenine(2503)-C(2))-methyltransferase RlmN [Desulfobacterales bacterium]|nr:23S rRNA (adenine(2503)-C(2))-methyltransferase RlmN [Desulfobacterales bacterium]